MYRKVIDITSTGMVTAEVFDSRGESKGFECFTQFISTNAAVEKSCIKAHKWADERIEVCKRQEFRG